ncbi:MAG: DUF2934 domain-containing protein [Burkholderiales bacterium]|nr:DUF2934 domain-containing protein [Burkholderiales bacterium]
MGLRRDSDKSKDQPAKKSGSGVKRKVGAAGKQDTATQPIQQDENEQVGEPARSTSVMSLTDNEAGSSDVDTQAIPATAIAGSSDVDTQAIPATAIAENADERHQKISASAYARAERRGFEPGKEEDDWLLAEAELYGGATREGEGAEQKWKQQRISKDSQ